MFDNPSTQTVNTNSTAQPVIVNGLGSPVRISIESAVSQKTQKPYDFLKTMIGEWEIRTFFQSPLERKEAERIIAMINKGNSVI